jgi:hypothetical protein
MKIRPVGAELHADGRTDMTKVIKAFRNFANAPKNERQCKKSSKKTSLSQKNATLFLCISISSVKHGACDRGAFFNFILKPSKPTVCYIHISRLKIKMSAYCSHSVRTSSLHNMIPTTNSVCFTTHP